MPFSASIWAQPRFQCPTEHHPGRMYTFSLPCNFFPYITHHLISPLVNLIFDTWLTYKIRSFCLYEVNIWIMESTLSAVI